MNKEVVIYSLQRIMKLKFILDHFSRHILCNYCAVKNNWEEHTFFCFIMATFYSQITVSRQCKYFVSISKSTLAFCAKSFLEKYRMASYVTGSRPIGNID